jgi:hypothetical protein
MDKHRKAVLRGEKSSIRDQEEIEALRRVAEQFTGYGHLVAEEYSKLAREGKLRGR